MLINRGKYSATYRLYFYAKRYDGQMIKHSKVHKKKLFPFQIIKIVEIKSYHMLIIHNPTCIHGC